MIWEGWNLDYWAQRATFMVKVVRDWRTVKYSLFYGHDELIFADVPDIPLHVRYKSFCDRLERKLLQH